MSFADGILTEDLEPLRQRLLSHPLWTGIEEGTVQRETLRVFALQDWWLVREAYRLDALAVAAMPDWTCKTSCSPNSCPRSAATACCCVSVRRSASHEPILTRWSRSRAAWRSPISSTGCSPTARSRRKSPR